MIAFHLPLSTSYTMTTVTCAIIERENKILIARRAEGQKLAGKWKFHGGNIEDREVTEVLA